MKLNNSQISALTTEVNKRMKTEKNAAVEAFKNSSRFTLLVSQEKKNLKKIIEILKEDDNVSYIKLKSYTNGFDKDTLEDKIRNKVLNDFSDKEYPIPGWDVIENKIILENIGAENLEELIEKVISSLK